MIRTLGLLGVSVFALAACTGEQAPKQVTYTVSEFVGPSPFHGLHGLAVEPDGTILAGSVVGQAIYAVNPATGEVTTRLGPPDGMADDIAFGPDGVMAWTGYLTGKVFVQEKGQAPRTVSSGLPGSNSLAFTKDGKLYMTQVFLGDALYEVDWKGTTGARLIRKDLGGLNGFEVGPDGMIYGPLWFKNAIVKVDPKDGKDTVVADGFQIPAAANFGPDGNLYALDTKTGEVKRIDMKTKAVSVIATLAPALDNLAFGPNGKMYVSNMAEANIYEVNPANGAVRTVVKGPLATPTDLAISDGPEGERLHVADIFAYRVINTADGAITDPLRMYRDETENQLGIGAGKSKVLIASWSTGAVQVVDRATGAATMHHGFAAPMDALELADGRLVVLEAATGVISLMGAADAAPQQLVTGLQMPVSMAEAADGKLYVTEIGGALARVDLATKEITRIVEGLAGPEGVDVGADGRIYVAEAGAGRVVAIDPKDSSKTVLAEGLKTGLPAVEGTLPAFAVTGVAVSKKDGAVYVSSDLTNAIYKLTPSTK
jgi:DNA-binding beta-propeller fold protein YncE